MAKPAERHEFFITKKRGRFLLKDGHNIEIDTFPTEAIAADIAVRFAQDNHQLYTIHYPN